jgi:hypothetical protein
MEDENVGKLKVKIDKTRKKKVKKVKDEKKEAIKYAHTIIKIFDTKTVDKKNKTDLQVIKWKSCKRPQLEFRRMYFDEKNNNWQFRKLAGITIDEFRTILMNAKEIMEALMTEVEDSDIVEVETNE